MDKELQIVAIWVEKYFIIENQTFNFGSEYVFDVKEQDNEIFINVKKTDSYCNIFNNAISNISCIVGENGAGKTTLIKIINLLKAGKPLKDNVLIVYKENDKWFYYLYKHTKKLINIKFKSNSILSDKKNNIFKSEKNPFELIDLIFYSNLLSKQNDRYLNNDDILNRSVDYNIRKEFEYEKVNAYVSKYKERINRNEITEGESFNILSLYFSKKEKRLFKFLADVNYKHKKIKEIINKINFPESISLWINQEIIYEETVRLIEISTYEFQRLKDIYAFCNKRNNEINDIKTRFKNGIIFNLFFIAFYNDFFKMTSNVSLKKLETFVNSVNLDKNIIEKLKSYLLNIDNNNKYYPIAKIKKIVQDIDSKFERIIIHPPDNVYESLSYKVEINDNLWEFLSLILEINDFKDNNLLEFGWGNLSSGERAILYQFSELYEAFGYLNNESIIVSIDEGELFLHPLWQREYISLINLFMNYFYEKLFDCNKRFQVILTTHSPFIASDLPKSNIVFLKKIKRKCVVLNSQTVGDTFASNIHHLFLDSFFMNNELIGAFANEKIIEVIKIINNKKIAKKDYAKQIIDIIGDPLIKNRLNDMWNSAFNEQIDLSNNDYKNWLKDELERIETTDKIKSFLLKNNQND